MSVVEERWGVKVAAVATLSGHQSPLTALQFTSHSSSLLASGGRDGSVRIWDVQVSRIIGGERWKRSISGPTTLLNLKYTVCLSLMSVRLDIHTLNNVCTYCVPVCLVCMQLCRLMKCVLSQSVGEVLDLTWTRSGLAICYKDTNVCVHYVYAYTHRGTLYQHTLCNDN